MKFELNLFFLFAALLATLSASAQEIADGIEYRIFGDFQTVVGVSTLPTSQRGTSAVSIPRLSLGSELLIKEGLIAVIEFEGAQYRDGTSGRMDVQVQKAYASQELDGTFSSQLRWGLVPQLWTEAMDDVWEYSQWGAKSRELSRRLGLSQDSDLALQYRADFGEDRGYWGFSIGNGEGEKQEETGPQKEAQILVKWNYQQPWTLYFHLLRGAYDAYSADTGVKERAHLALGYQDGRWQFLIEGIQGKEPADAIKANSTWEGFDATLLSGQVIDYRGSSFLARYEWTTNRYLIWRLDSFVPFPNQEGRSLDSYFVGVAAHHNDNLSLVGGYQNTRYSKAYTLNSREADFIFVSSRLSF